MPPIRVGFRARKSPNKGLFFGRFSLCMGKAVAKLALQGGGCNLGVMV